MLNLDDMVILNFGFTLSSYASITPSSLCYFCLKKLFVNPFGTCLERVGVCLWNLSRGCVLFSCLSGLWNKLVLIAVVGSALNLPNLHCRQHPIIHCIWM